MTKLIAANWKMNPQSYAEAEKLANATIAGSKGKKNVEVVLCPPFPWLTDFSHKSSKAIRWGAQDVFWENRGAYTGEVSPVMLKNSGVEYVIIGHSERRMSLGETDEMVNKKVQAALRAGLKVILCVGEPLSVRKQGTTAVLRYVRRQLAHAVKNVPKGKRGRIVVAYEPIWAIGTGIPCDLYLAERMVHACAAELALKEGFRYVRGLYGGSVNARNAKSYLNAEYIDGLLVGGSSLNAREFRKIVTIASNVEE